jgi:hypothetical protein
MASIRAIQVGNRKGLKIELGGFKEAKAKFELAVSAMDDVSATSAKQKIGLEFERIASDFRNALKASALQAGVPNRVYRAIFSARKNMQKVSVLVGSAKRVAKRYPSTKQGGLRMEWRDFTKKAGANQGKRVSMSLPAAYNQGTKKTLPTKYFDRIYNAQRPSMLRRMIAAYKRVIGE